MEAWFWFEKGKKKKSRRKKKAETREPHLDCPTLFVLSKEAWVTEPASLLTSSHSLCPVRGPLHILLICDSICYTVCSLLVDLLPLLRLSFSKTEPWFSSAHPRPWQKTWHIVGLNRFMLNEHIDEWPLGRLRSGQQSPQCQRHGQEPHWKARWPGQPLGLSAVELFTIKW